jgi:hypothetical protein
MSKGTYLLDLLQTAFHQAMTTTFLMVAGLLLPLANYDLCPRVDPEPVGQPAQADSQSSEPEAIEPSGEPGPEEHVSAEPVALISFYDSNGMSSSS